MIRVAVAQNYARALYQLSQEKQISEKVLKSLEFFEAQLQKSTNLLGILQHPLVDKKEKKQLIQEIFHLAPEKDIPEEAPHLFFLMIDKERGGLIEEVIEWYRRSYQEDRDIRVVEVISPKELKDEHKEIIKENMKKYTGRQVVLQEKQDPTITGGVVLKLGSRMLDGSLDTRLKRLEEHLIKPGSK